MGPAREAPSDALLFLLKLLSLKFLEQPTINCTIGLWNLLDNIFLS